MSDVIEEPDWIAQARILIGAGGSVIEVARFLGKSADGLRYALDINGAKQKQKARICASRAKDRAERVGVKPKAPGRRLAVVISEERISARAYAEPAPRRPLTLPKISMPDLHEPMIIRFAPKTRAEPEGVERWRTVHLRMIRQGKIPAPDLLSDFNA